MTVKLLIEHNLEFVSLKGGCKASSESTLVKIPHCWRSYVTAHLLSHDSCADFVQNCGSYRLFESRFTPTVSGSKSLDVLLPL